jgi:hypothetical protein
MTYDEEGAKRSRVRVDHVTYEIPLGHLNDPHWDEFFGYLGMTEVEPDPVIEKNWRVRWWTDSHGTLVHIVEGDLMGFSACRGLGHFCIEVDENIYQLLKDSEWREQIGSGEQRIWLGGPSGIRVELRPHSSPHASHEESDTPREPSTALYARSSGEDPGLADQEAVMIEALNIYRERNRKYKDNWRRYGWRGCLYDLRRKVERAWDLLWNAEDTEQLDVDDLLDVINYAAITVRAVRELNRDGTGRWWPHE